MKRFNPEKELSKIKNGSKNKILYGIIALLLIVAVGSTYALYQVRHSNKLTHITVKQFYQNDLDLAVYVDGVKKVTEKEFPTKENGTNLIYTGIKCEDGKEINASWDYDTWALDVKSKLPNKCNVYFETRWKDSSGAAYPELYQGMIPITISDTGELTVADVTTKWYSYNDHEWANAILIDDTKNHDKYYNEDGTYKKNTTIPIEDVLQMYVWIPRYKYKLFNAEYGISEPQEIEIEFENNTTGRSTGTNNGEWYTHPAFLFGDTELNGIWVGKFEASDSQDVVGRNSEIGEITILPNKTSMVDKTIKTMFDATRKIEELNKYNMKSSEIDTHIMKNSEWGAVAYLSHSKYGTCSNSVCKEVWINNTSQGASTSEYGGTATGCVGNETHDRNIQWSKGGDNPAECPEGHKWNQSGVNASTTGNVYGIYDMSGGMWDYVMGVLSTETGDDIYYGDGFTKENMPDKKYFDIYKYGTNNLDFTRGHLGDATREVLTKFNATNGSWDASQSDMLSITEALKGYMIFRGNRVGSSVSGIFSFGRHSGVSSALASFHVVLTAQD